MAKGLSIHIGLNHLDERYYGGRFSLSGCLGDVRAMADLATDAGFEPLVLEAECATASAVLDAIARARGEVGNDGLLLITYSGHGGRVPDANGDEGDGFDETWCLYDRELLDDELYDSWGDFPAGARILVVSDSCFSGDMIREDQRARSRSAPSRTIWGLQAVEGTASPGSASVATADRPGNARGALRGGAEPQRRRALSKDASKHVFMRNRQLYKEIQRSLGPRRPVEAEVLLLSAARDNETAADGDGNGAFTRALLDVWNGGAFKGDYVALHQALYDRLAPGQHPVLLALKPPSFARTRPFSI